MQTRRKKNLSIDGPVAFLIAIATFYVLDVVAEFATADRHRWFVPMLIVSILAGAAALAFRRR